MSKTRDKYPSLPKAAMAKKRRENDSKDGLKQSLSTQPTKQLIFKFKVVNPSDSKVKLLFKDRDGKMVQEIFHIYQYNKQKYIHLILGKPCLQLRVPYSDYEDRKWEKLSQVGVQALMGKWAQLWSSMVESWIET